MRRAVFAAALIGAAVAAMAQESPSEVTDAEIARYKAFAQKGCREGGMARKDPQEVIDSFCNCFMAALEKSMKRTEWQQAYFYMLKQQDAEQKNVLAPHVQNLAYCRAAPTK